MIIHPIAAQEEVGATQDSAQAVTSIPEGQPEGIERAMLSEDKLYVVLAVVLIIWFGIAFFLYRTDRKLKRLERYVDAHDPEQPMEQL